ncbi:MAG TPA: type II toxin-antitoxin system VapC family toxin [Thermoanaerobaculia bacterium]|jgi:predicted nucleic acid-binding protein
MRIVIDASVVVKWVFPESAAEENTEEALALLAEIKSGTVDLLQPPHWLAEVAAVVTRLRPEIADSVLDLLDAMELPVVYDLAIFKTASRIARDLNHHLFDTLYHAVALEYGGTLVSADGRYFRKARPLGRIVPLARWPDILPT